VTWLSLWSLFAAFRDNAPARGADARETSLQIEPARVSLNGRDAHQQLVVTLRGSDGSLRDVTSICKFGVEPEDVASITPGGAVLPTVDGQAVLRARYRDQTAEVPLRVERSSLDGPVSFRADIVPLLSKAGCNAGTCHGNFKGKEGFRLSLRGEDPAFDFQILTHEVYGRRVDRVAPAESLIFRKPTGTVPHEGGLRFNRHSSEAVSLLRWIASGARDDVASASGVRSFSVFPSERISAPGSMVQQLVVTAELDDGTTRDVTRQAAYELSDPTGALVTEGGLVRARGPCETVVAVRYMNGRGTSRLAFLAEEPGFVWNGPAKFSHPVDTLVFARLKALRKNSSGLASDTVFLRRAYLDSIGRLPEAAETRSFLDDRDPAKREHQIDRLVARPEFADFWALKWADVLRNEEKTMGEKGAWVLERWLRDQIARDMPLDELVRRIVAGLGSTWQNPPSSFYRTNRDPMTAAESVSQVFLGLRLQCARCHNHPFDVWTQDDYYGLAAYFANIARKQINNVRKDKFDTHEINGDEVIYLAGLPKLRHPRSGALIGPRWLEHEARTVTHNPAHTALEELADRLTCENRQFSRNMANRIWFHLFGRGIVEPPDDFRASNPPSNPALLEALSDYFEANGKRLKPLVAWIMKSRTYQQNAAPDRSNASDEANFARASVRLLPAEVLLDAISQVAGYPETFPRAPRWLRAAQLPGAAIGASFLKTFGKPDRLLTCECERSESTTLAQAFQMISGETVRRKLEARDNRIGQSLAAGVSDSELMSEIYLAALCRQPAEAERAALLAHLKKAPARRKAWEDILWALLSSKEFLLRH
jgi:hypothetical protein